MGFVPKEGGVEIPLCAHLEPQGPVASKRSHLLEIRGSDAVPGVAVQLQRLYEQVRHVPSRVQGGGKGRDGVQA